MIWDIVRVLILTFSIQTAGPIDIQAIDQLSNYLHPKVINVIVEVEYNKKFHRWEYKINGKVFVILVDKR